MNRRNVCMFKKSHNLIFLRRIPASGLHRTDSCAICTNCSLPASTWLPSSGRNAWLPTKGRLPSTATRLPRPSSFCSTAWVSTSNCSTYSANLHCTYASKFPSLYSVSHPCDIYLIFDLDKKKPRFSTD